MDKDGLEAAAKMLRALDVAGIKTVVTWETMAEWYRDDYRLTALRVVEAYLSGVERAPTRRAEEQAARDKIARAMLHEVAVERRKLREVGAAHGRSGTGVREAVVKYARKHGLLPEYRSGNHNADLATLRDGFKTGRLTLPEE